MSLWKSCHVLSTRRSGNRWKSSLAAVVHPPSASDYTEESARLPRASKPLESKKRPRRPPASFVNGNSASNNHHPIPSRPLPLNASAALQLKARLVNLVAQSKHRVSDGAMAHQALESVLRDSRVVQQDPALAAELVCLVGAAQVL